MNGSININECVYNPLFVKFNEYFRSKGLFSYNLQFPSFHNFKNSSDTIDQSILNDINSIISLDASTFKQGLFEEEQNYNLVVAEGGALPKKRYKAFSIYAVTFNRNNILSVTLRLRGISSGNKIEYDNLNNYNIDLISGKRIKLEEIFNPNVNYFQIINNYINYKIRQNKELYYENTVINIPYDQSFYITDKGVVIYFGLDQIAPTGFGFPKFLISFGRFADYINPRFLCGPQMPDMEPRFRY